MLIPSAGVQEIYTATGYKSMPFYQKILCSPNVEWITDNKLIIRLIRLVKFQVGLINWWVINQYFLFLIVFSAMWVKTVWLQIFFVFQFPIVLLQGLSLCSEVCYTNVLYEVLLAIVLPHMEQVLAPKQAQKVKF